MGSRKPGGARGPRRSSARDRRRQNAELERLVDLLLDVIAEARCSPSHTRTLRPSDELPTYVRLWQRPRSAVPLQRATVVRLAAELREARRERDLAIRFGDLLLAALMRANPAGTERLLADVNPTRREP
jgi:hypothetical protein